MALLRGTGYAACFGGRNSPPRVWVCSGCGRNENEEPGINEEYSLGIYAGRYHEACWERAPYRKEGREGFDPSDCGESYEED